MRNLVVLFIHLIATLARLLGPGGVRSLIAESLLLKHQLLIVNRSRQRSPNLPSSDRILAGLLALLVRPARLLRSAIVLKPSTLLALHKAMSTRKYRMLFSPNRPRMPGPKGPRDRKSTRLNSSHLGISYAVFCLKKKKNKKTVETVRHTMKINAPRKHYPRTYRPINTVYTT